MPTDHIIALLVAERDKLNRAIEALGGVVGKRRGRPPKKSSRYGNRLGCSTGQETEGWYVGRRA